MLGSLAKVGGEKESSILHLCTKTSRKVCSRTASARKLQTWLLDSGIRFSLDVMGSQFPFEKDDNILFSKSSLVC